MKWTYIFVLIFLSYCPACYNTSPLETQDTESPSDSDNSDESTNPDTDTDTDTVDTDTHWPCEWKQVYPQQIAIDLYDVLAFDSGEVYILGENNTVLYSDGEILQTAELQVPTDIKSMWGLDPSDLFVVGDSSNDEPEFFHFNGTDWTSIVVPSKVESIDLLWGSKTDNVYMMARVDGNLTIISYDGSQWHYPLYDTDREFKHPANHLSAWATSKTDLFTIAQHTSPHFPNPTTYNIYHRNSTGSLSLSFPASLKRPSHLWSPNANTLFILGEDTVTPDSDGSLFHRYYLDEEQFTLLGPPLASSCRSMWSTDEDHVYCVSEGQVMLNDGTQWSTEMTGFGVILDINGTSAENIWVVGTQGQIYHFDGFLWKMLSGYPHDGFSDITGLSANNIYAAGDTLFQGAESSWSPLNVGEVSSVQKIWVNGPNDVYATTDEAEYLHYDGFTWTRHLLDHIFQTRITHACTMLPSGTALLSNSFTSADGTPYYTIETLSGDNVWSQMPVQPPEMPHKFLWAHSENNIYAVSESSGALWHFDEGAWSIVQQFAGNPITALFGNSPDELYVIVDHREIHNFDGTTWRQIGGVSTIDGLTDNTELLSVWASSPKDIVVAVNSCKLLRFDGEIWRTEGPFDISGCYQIDSLFGTDANNIWAFAKRIGGGQGGTVYPPDTILFYNGKEWSLNYLPEPYKHFHAVSGISSDPIGLVDSTGSLGSNIVEHNDGNWGEPQTETIDQFTSLCAAQGTDLLAFDSKGAMVRKKAETWRYVSSLHRCNRINDLWGDGQGTLFFVCNEGGFFRHREGTWTQLNRATQNNLRSIYGSTASDILAIGTGAGVFHYDGETVSQIPFDGSDELVGVWATQSGEFFIADNKNAIYRYDGTTWATYHFNESEMPSHIFGFGPNNVFGVAGNENPTMSRFDGTSWQTIRVNAFLNSTISGLWGSGPTDIYAVSSDRAIYHTECK